MIKVDNQEKRNFIWNLIGSLSVALSYPLITIISSRYGTTKDAGIISVAFLTAQMFMIVGNFCMRTFQASDVREKYSFNDYFWSRVVTCIFMIMFTISFCIIRGYKGEIFLLNILLCIVKMLDAFGDVYEGRLQQIGRLDLAGMAQSIRAIGTTVAFGIVYIISKNVIITVVFMFVLASIITIFFDIITTHRIDQSYKSKKGVKSTLYLLASCLPICISQLIFTYIINSPKYALEDFFPYEVQIIFTALFFPAVVIHMLCGMIYRPFIVRLSTLWDTAELQTINNISKKIILFIISLVLMGAATMYIFGCKLLSYVYGLSLETYKNIAVLMIISGGLIAYVNYAYNLLTIIRASMDLLVIYITAGIMSLIIPGILTSKYGLMGAVLGLILILFFVSVLISIDYYKLVKRKLEV